MNGAVSIETMLRAIREKTLAVIISVTEPDMRKRSDEGVENPFLGRLAKVSVAEVILNHNYRAAVNERRIAEGKDADFIPAPRKWGRHVEGTPLIEHNGQLYLEYQGSRVFDVAYRLDGQVVQESAFEPWLKKRSENKSQGLDAPIEVRTVKLDNLLAVVPTAAL